MLATTQGRTQAFLNTEVSKCRLVGGFGGMLPWENLDFPDLHVCILRYYNSAIMILVAFGKITCLKLLNMNIIIIFLFTLIEINIFQ